MQMYEGTEVSLHHGTLPALIPGKEFQVSTGILIQY